jgi:cobalt/nickel transport protein
VNDFKKNSLLLLVIAALLIITLWAKSGAEFAGADDRASQIVGEIDPDYQPWMKNVWVPPSAEIASLLFAVQASLGTGFICFYLGYKVGQKKRDGGGLIDQH